MLTRRLQNDPELARRRHRHLRRGPRAQPADRHRARTRARRPWRRSDPTCACWRCRPRRTRRSWPRSSATTAVRRRSSRATVASTRSTSARSRCRRAARSTSASRRPSPTRWPRAARGDGRRARVPPRHRRDPARRDRCCATSVPPTRRHPSARRRARRSPSRTRRSARLRRGGDAWSLSTDIAESSLTVAGVRIVVDAGLARVPRFDPRTGHDPADRPWRRVARPPTSAQDVPGAPSRASATACGASSSRAPGSRTCPPRSRRSTSPASRSSWRRGARTPTHAARSSTRHRRKALRAAEELLRDARRARRRRADHAARSLAARAAGAPAAGADGRRRRRARPAARVRRRRDRRRARRAARPHRRAARRPRATGCGSSAATRATTAPTGEAIERARDRALDIAEACPGRPAVLATSTRLGPVRCSHSRIPTASASPALAGEEPGGPVPAAHRRRRVGRARRTRSRRERFVVAADLDGSRTNARIRLGAGLDAAELERSLASGDRAARSSLVWDKQRDDLVQRDGGAPRQHAARRAGRGRPSPGPATVDGAASSACGRRDSAALDMDAAATLRARVAFLRSLPADAPAARTTRRRVARLVGRRARGVARRLAGAVPRPCDGRADLERLDVGDAADERSCRGISRPSSPSSRRRRSSRRRAGRSPIDYTREPPTVSVRVQIVFGTTKHPTVVGGRVPLAVELLSPADRPIQITRDLPGFWIGHVGRRSARRWPAATPSTSGHPSPSRDPVRARRRHSVAVRAQTRVCQAGLRATTIAESPTGRSRRREHSALGLRERARACRRGRSRCGRRRSSPCHARATPSSAAGGTRKLYAPVARSDLEPRRSAIGGRSPTLNRRAGVRHLVVAAPQPLAARLHEADEPTRASDPREVGHDRRRVGVHPVAQSRHAQHRRERRRRRTAARSDRTARAGTRRSRCGRRREPSVSKSASTAGGDRRHPSAGRAACRRRRRGTAHPATGRGGRRAAARAASACCAYHQCRFAGVGHPAVLVGVHGRRSWHASISDRDSSRLDAANSTAADAATAVAVRARSPARRASSPVGSASSVPTSCTAWSPAVPTVRVVDALVPDHGGDLRNVDGLDVDVVVADIGDARRRRRARGRRRRVQPRRSGQPHGVDARPAARTCSSTRVTHSRFLEHAARASARQRASCTPRTRQVYGRAIRVPVDEEHPANPVDVNGVAKLAGEQLHLVYAHAYGDADHVAAADQRVRPAPAADERRARLPARVRPQGAARTSRSSCSATGQPAPRLPPRRRRRGGDGRRTRRGRRSVGCTTWATTSTTRSPRSPRSSCASPAARARSRAHAVAGRSRADRHRLVPLGQRR